MKAEISATVRVLVATLFMMFATLGPVGSRAYADPNPPSNNGDVQATKVVTITPVKPIPTPPACEGRGEGRGEVVITEGDSKRPPQKYVFNFKTPQHYGYSVKGKALLSGTSFPANGETLTITAVPDSGYTFGKATAKWDYTLTPVRCGG